MPTIYLLSGDVLLFNCETPKEAIAAYRQLFPCDYYQLKFTFHLQDDGDIVLYDLEENTWIGLRRSFLEWNDLQFVLTVTYNTYTLNVDLICYETKRITTKEYTRKRFSSICRQSDEYRINEWDKFFTEVLDDFGLTSRQRLEICTKLSHRYLIHPDCEALPGIYYFYPNGITVSQWLDYITGTNNCSDIILRTLN